MRGDNLGTPAESAVKATWPDYNAEYLKKKLNGQQRRFDPDDLDDIEKHVYLQQSVKGYEAEAEACLKEEFKQWLQGTHEANVEDEMGNGYYVNNDGGSGPKRRHVYDGVVSAEMADNGVQGPGWRATRWSHESYLKFLIDHNIAVPLLFLLIIILELKVEITNW